MNEQSKGFKASLVGGFNREDVLRYIERNAQETQEQTALLTHEIESLRAECETLKQSNIELSQKNAELLERLGEMTVASEKQRKETEEKDKRIAQDAQTLLSLQEKRETLEETCGSLKAQVEELSERCEEYNASKERLAEIELCAFRRAKEIEDRAAYNAKRIRVQSAELINMIKNELLSVTQGYHSAVSYAKQQAESISRRADDALSRIDGAVSKLDGVMVGELSEEESDTRPKMEQVIDIMKGNSGE